MSKLSPSLKALINAPFARPGACAASAQVREVFQALAGDASRQQIGTRPWLALSAATTFTLNSPDSLSILHDVASAQQKGSELSTAEFIREVGLKCISFNGIPRTINCLNAFYAGLPKHVAASLSTTPTRAPTPDSLEEMKTRGRALWDSVYAPFETKLLEKLGRSHPDLPVHILNGNYALLLSNPPPDRPRGSLATLGRVNTSLVAIACLRAQTGVGPQVLSHVFGLRKALADGTAAADEPPEAEAAVAWLASDEGGAWILGAVDRIVDGLEGANFAAGATKSKL